MILPTPLMESHEGFISSACRQTYCKHTAEDDLEVFSTEDPGLDWISAHNFLTRLQNLSSYASGHLEVSELAACLEKASFSCTSGHVEVFQNLLLILSFSSPPSQTDFSKNECTSLLKDLLSHLGYFVGRNDIINIDSLRKHSSLVEFSSIPEVHTLFLLTKSKS
ncbi:hypothetical protein Tco_0972793 [Tanacetum coccineum]